MAGIFSSFLLQRKVRNCTDAGSMPITPMSTSAFPGYYGVTLPTFGITAELTATRRVGVHRYTFSERQVPHILLHVTSALGRGYGKSGEVRILPEAREVEGAVRTFGTFSKRYGGLKVYFVAQFNRPFHNFAAWTGETETPGQPIAKGDDLGVNLGFQLEESSRVIELKLAISYVSIANARANLEQEAGKKSFDQILADAVVQWEEKLARIQIWGGSAASERYFARRFITRFRCRQSSKMRTASIWDSTGKFMNPPGSRTTQTCLYGTRFARYIRCST